MAKATKRGGRSGAAVILDLPVHFGNVNVGDATASVGVGVAREALPIGTADKQLVGRRLVGTIIGQPAGSGPDQGALKGMNDEIALTGTFDVKRIGVSRKKITCGLTFSLGDINVSELARFAKRAGHLKIESSAAIPEKEAEDEEENEEEPEKAYNDNSAPKE